MEQIFGAIIGTIIALIFGIPMILRRKQGKKDIADTVNRLEIEVLQISPDMKQSLNEFSVENATQLRQMKAEELINLLSCSAKVLKIFEKRIEQISSGYNQIDNYIAGQTNGMLDFGMAQKDLERKYAPTKERLDKQVEQAMIVFDEDLMSVGSVLRAIPERYRLSIILNKMCEYLSDGEVDSWEGCVKTFKEDMHRIQQNEHFTAFQNSLDRIDRNTAISVFFSGITAWNTRNLS